MGYKLYFLSPDKLYRQWEHKHEAVKATFFFLMYDNSPWMRIYYLYAHTEYI